MRSCRLTRLALWLWTAAVISAALLPGTLARYAAAGEGSAAARVAAWGHSPSFGGDTSAIIWLRPNKGSITGKSS